MTRVTDDSWKKVQQNTFTNWINNSLRGHLKKADRQVDNLTEGFQDGLTLIQLLETVSRKKVGRHNQNPKIKAQMMENLEASFKFMDTEDIKLVNIGENCAVRVLLMNYISLYSCSSVRALQMIMGNRYIK